MRFVVLFFIALAIQALVTSTEASTYPTEPMNQFYKSLSEITNLVSKGYWTLKSFRRKLVRMLVDQLEGQPKNDAKLNKFHGSFYLDKLVLLHDFAADIPDPQLPILIKELIKSLCGHKDDDLFGVRKIGKEKLVEEECIQ